MNQYTIENVIQELHHLKENDAYSSKWLSNFLFSYTEKERVRLAGDLHDVVLQELVVINRGLESILKEALSDKMHTEVYAVREKVLDCIHTTRETCNQLAPPFLMEFGLIQALEQLIKRIHLRQISRFNLIAKSSMIVYYRKSLSLHCTALSRSY